MNEYVNRLGADRRKGYGMNEYVNRLGADRRKGYGMNEYVNRCPVLNPVLGQKKSILKPYLLKMLFPQLVYMCQFSSSVHFYRQKRIRKHIYIYIYIYNNITSQCTQVYWIHTSVLKLVHKHNDIWHVFCQPPNFSILVCICVALVLHVLD